MVPSRRRSCISSSSVTIGRLLPRLIAALLVIDALSRFLTLDPLCFQAWECMTRYQEPGAIFEANRQFRSAKTHGNLSNIGNLPARMQERPQVFSTDRYGFRNASGLVDKRIDGVVVGDSFVAGYGNSDEDTFPVQLSGSTGSNYYNAGGPYAYLATARLLKSRLTFGAHRAIVVWTENVPIAFYNDAEARAQSPDSKARILSSAFGVDGNHVRAWLRGWWFTSPVKIVAEKGFLSIANDRILPNIYANKVVQRRLTNGEPVLFYPPDIEAFDHPPDARPAIEHLVWLATGLRKEGFDPFVVLAPSKYSVYYPLLDGSGPEAAAGEQLVSPLEESLQSEGIPALDLTRAFREQARKDLSKGRYLYWLDDTHWNARGIAVAAHLVQQRLSLQTVSEGSQ